MLHSIIAAIILTCAMALSAVAQSNDQETVGIGMAFERSPEGWIRVGGVLPDGPAQKAGIAAGDYVLAVDGADVRPMQNDDLMQKLRGAKGTELKLTVVSNGQQQPHEVSITRAVIPARSGPGNNPGNNPRNQPGDQPGNPQPRGNPPQNPLSPSAPVKGTQKFSLVTLNDPQVGNIPALQVMAPQGWDVRGQIIWMPEFSTASNLELLITDPATGLAIQWLPTQSFIWMQNPPGQVANGGNYQGRVWMQPLTDPAQFIGWFYAEKLAHLRSAKAVASEEFPNLEKFYAAQMPPGQKGVRSVRVRYEFTGPNQKPWEEDVYLTLAFNTNAMGATFWDALGANSARGPKGSLDANAGLVHAILHGANFTPQWIATRVAVQDLFTKGIKDMQRDQQVFAAKLAQYRDQIARQSQQISDDRQRSQAAQNESFREVLGGVENYKDPYKSENIYLPAGYKEYWANAKGEYILSEQTGYNPNVGNTEEWKKIDRVDPMQR